MDTATMLWGILFGSIGMGYFMYGKKQSDVVFRYTGLVLMVYPYFISSTLVLVIAGIVLILLPIVLKKR